MDCARTALSPRLMNCWRVRERPASTSSTKAAAVPACGSVARNGTAPKMNLRGWDARHLAKPAVGNRDGTGSTRPKPAYRVELVRDQRQPEAHTKGLFCCSAAI